MTTHDQYNQTCVVCHVTGFGVSRGYADLIRTAWLANVQCEACHGMSVKHVKSPQTEKPGLGFKARRDSCVRCHTPENSPSFNSEKYWAKIEH
jgi:hypothetical protein